METNEHVMLCVLGRTACGKDSLTNKLCERTKLNAITSYTTRPRRENEGDTHIFTTKEVYEQMKAEGNVAAYTEIAGYLYWTTIDQLYKNDILYRISILIFFVTMLNKSQKPAQHKDKQKEAENYFPLP